MFKKYEIPILIVSIFILILILRFLFHFSFKNEFELGENVNLEHTFLRLPFKNEFQQYLYIENVLVTLPLFPEYGYGDKVRLKGVVESYVSNTDKEVLEKLIIKNPEAELVENRGLAVLKFVRQKVLSAYKSVLPPREAGLIAGIVLGAEDGIDLDFKNELKKTGMLHVVVASGSNVILVAGIVFNLITGLVKKRLAIIFTIAGIFFYAFLTGFDPPIVRASIMASFAFSAMLLGRQKVAMLSLLFSGWIMLMVSPKLISDIGFQLSFSASFGILLFQRVIHYVVRFVPRIVRDDFATTISAQIGALPFLLIAFGEVNLLSIFINVILLWTVPVIMIFGLAGGVLGLISPYLAQPLILIAYPFLAFFSYVVSLTSNFYIPLTLTSIFTPIAVIYYVLLVYILTSSKFKVQSSKFKVQSSKFKD